MIIKTSFPKCFGFAAITMWPFIFITPELAEDKPLIEHELVHYREQRKWLVLPWWVVYLTNKTFRFNAEIRGHAAQFYYNGCSLQWAAAHIVSKYKTGKSLEQTKKALQEALWHK
jgi:hypothetical protein